MAANFAGYADADTPPPQLDAAGMPVPVLPVIVIPAVYWESERVCVQEMVQGIPGTRLASVDEARTGPPPAGPARRPRGAEDDHPRRLLPRRSAPGQRVLPGRQSHRL